jgi:hypothetical protein
LSPKQFVTSLAPQTTKKRNKRHEIKNKKNENKQKKKTH